MQTLSSPPSGMLRDDAARPAGHTGSPHRRGRVGPACPGRHRRNRRRRQDRAGRRIGSLVSAAGRPVIRASIDRFHNPADVRRRRGRLSPEGYYRDSFDYAGLVAELLEPLDSGGNRLYRTAVFDFRTDCAVASKQRQAPVNAVLIMDGVFLLRPELRSHWDFSVFVRADFSVTLARAEKRDLALFGNGAEIRERYERRYIPGQRLYLTEARPEFHATVVIDNNVPGVPFEVAPV